MKWVFWISALALTYTYFGYPAWLWLRTQYRPRPVHASPNTLSVSIVMAVRNEVAVLERKLQNLLSLDYPEDLSEIVIVSDGSTDSTNQILNYHSADRRVRIILNPQSEGKAAALNQAIAAARGEIVVFADARQKIETDALRLLTASFSDPEVGCASGELMLGNPESGQAVRGIGLYWRVDKIGGEVWGPSGSVGGATGALFAVRRNFPGSCPPPS